ncbi:hypothetical protein AQUCO_02400156v1, partial [Aquilegia coerulea]
PLVIASSSNKSDRFALLAFKSQIRDDPLGALASWNDSLHHCDWQGITCSRRHPQRVTVLDLRYQKLGGTLSPYIGNLSFLRKIILIENNFYGEIPQEIGRLFRLQSLILTNNSFEGEIPSNITYCSDLRVINLIDNKLSGSIFPGFSSLSKLLDLSLAKNNFMGKLPSSLGNLSSLNELSLADNHLEGIIPEDLCNIQSLGFFQVSVNNLTVASNQLEGSLPPNIGLTLPNLKEIYFGGNKFSGLIPVSLSNATRLEVIDIGYNAFTGSVPRELGKLQALQFLVSDFNQLGTEGKLNQLGKLYLGENLLSGQIPSSIGNLTQLNILGLSHNHFNGHIPTTLGNCKNLAALDLSQNNLVGTIPIQVISLSSLTEGLHLHQNSLTGPLPSQHSTSLRVFANASLVSVVGNRNLCGGIKGLKLRPCIQKKIKKKTSLSFKVIIPIIVGSLCLIFLLFFFLIFYGRKMLNKNQASTTLFNIPSYKRVSYLDLLRATNEFSADYLIGVGSYGSVFKGIFQDINQVVAVKVLNLQREGASKSFLTECNALRHLRHRNLLKIITACSSMDFQGNDFKALVFQFMPYGSLEKWLHPRVNEQQHDSRTLSFIQRLNIAIDVASALDYLHHRCQPAVVHCDLKPSNVLLDDDMTARVADFGIAKLFSAASYDSAQSQPSSDVIRGSIGYVAPVCYLLYVCLYDFSKQMAEYGMGVRVSIQGDVYSYGILLLEMFTRKRPTDDMFLNGLSLHNYAEMALPNQVMGIIDPLVLLEDNTEVTNTVEQSKTGGRLELERCLVSAITLGVTCSAEAPAQRMKMSDVVSELLHIKKHHQDYSTSISE